MGVTGPVAAGSVGGGAPAYVEAAGARHRLIATDGVFSMDGCIADLPAICDLAERCDALVRPWGNLTEALGGGTGVFSLKGHTGIVTGGASGIGLATGRALAGCGANVVVADIDEEAGARVAEDLRADGADARFTRADVADANDVDAMVEATVGRFGSLEILMHFAGIGVERHALDTTREEWDRILAVNLTGTFLVMQAAGAVMVEAGYGRIVSMASVAGERGGTGRTAYGASKGGVAAMTRVMALEWARHGVTVNTLAPGAIDTALVKRMHDAETRRAYLQAIPMGRYGVPEEVASAAVCLALPASSYITGITLPVDGGFASSGVIKRD